MATVVLGMPMHNQQVHAKAARAFWGCPSAGKNRCLPGAHGSSLLAKGFNTIWHGALEIRRREPERGITHFGMLHADIAPEPGWVDVLVDEMERTGADVVSAVVPIKDGKGLTSTAVEDPADEWSVLRRLTMREVHRLPETFSIDDLGYDDGRALLVNTGCWLADLSKPWCRDVVFTIRDCVRFLADGTPEVCVIPEDWGFSKWLHGRGGKVLATRKVKLVHFGGADGYGNTEAWGSSFVDEAYSDKFGGLPLPCLGAGVVGRGRGAAPVGTGDRPDGARNRLVDGPLDRVPCAVGSNGDGAGHLSG